MKVISFSDIKNLNIPMGECYSWAKEMILRKDEMLLPPKISLKPDDGVFFNVMPSVVNVDGAQYGGVKIVTRYPSRSPSLDSKILLYDIDSGEELALMDGNWITAVRTGAVATHSILTLANSNFSVIGMIGLGNIARTTLDILLNMAPEKNFDIKLYRYHETEKSFVERFNNYKNVKFSFVDDYSSLVKGSDVVVSCVTYAPEDFCANDAFDEGVLVVPVHTLGFTNCDLFFDKIFADDKGHVCHFKNFEKFKNFAEMSDVVSGKVEGRENDKERILAYNIGISIHDIYFAAKLYSLLKDNSNIPEINPNIPSDKYWA